MTDELRHAHDRWNQAWMVNDAATVDELMAPDYTHITPSGQIMERPVLMEIISDPTFKITEAAHDDVNVRPIAEDVGLVLHRWKGKGNYGGHHFEDDHRVTSIWVRSGGDWRVVHEQVSPIVES